MKKRFRFCSRILGLSLAAAASSAIAVPSIFFGEDLNPGGVVPAGGNAATARASFLSQLAGVGNETFQSIATGTVPPLALSFPGSIGSITATISTSSSIPGGVCDTVTAALVGGIFCNGFGRFPTSGTHWYHTTDQFRIDFSDPISAFGFFGTDIGDFSGQLTATLVGGATVNLTIPNTVDAPNGSLLFWGFIDSAASYTSIQFVNTQAGTDVFGFDDMVIGDERQVIPASEPGTLALMGLVLVGLGFTRRWVHRGNGRLRPER